MVRRFLISRIFALLPLAAGICLMVIGLIVGMIGLVGMLGITRRVEYLFALAALLLYSGWHMISVQALG